MIDNKTGGLDILNAGAGHIEIRYDKNDAVEINRAKRIIEDMLRRGYSLFIEEDGKLTRVHSFDMDKGVYIIEEVGAYVPEATTQPTKRGRVKGKRQVHLTEAKATAIARTAGG